MNLRYISLHIDHDSGYPDEKRQKFNMHSRFLSNFLSVNIRKLKFNTDGTFNMIAITPSLNIQHICRLVGDNALQVRLEFNDGLYDKMNESEKIEYYLQLLSKVFAICSEYKEIPVSEMTALLNSFRISGYKNKWLHKEKRFRSFDLSVKTECSFTSDEFQLSISVQSINEGIQLINGVILTTQPHELFFEDEFKDVLIIERNLVITDRFDRPKIEFLLDDIYNGQFQFKKYEYS